LTSTTVTLFGAGLAEVADGEDIAATGEELMVEAV
jgi:hypothetical protein